jgi:hypothetical protein
VAADPIVAVQKRHRRTGWSNGAILLSVYCDDQERVKAAREILVRADAEEMSASGTTIAALLATVLQSIPETSGKHLSLKNFSGPRAHLP